MFVRCILNQVKYFCSKSTGKKSNLKIAVCNATGKVGSSVALFLHLSKLADELVLYDTSPRCCQLGLNLSFMNLENKVKCFSGKGMLRDALQGANIVVSAPLDTFEINSNNEILSPSDMFTFNAKIIEEICDVLTEVCYDATLVMGISPINSIVPFTYEVLKRKGHTNPQKILGVNSLDILRFSAMACHIKSQPNLKIKVPVIGGTSFSTAVPLLSQAQPCTTFNEEEASDLVNAFRSSKLETDVSLDYSSTAYATAYFTIALARAMRGEENIEECCFTGTDNYLGLGYMAVPARFGRNGLEEIIKLPLNSYEKKLLEDCKTCLKGDIAKGISWAKDRLANRTPSCDWNA